MYGWPTRMATEKTSITGTIEIVRADRKRGNRASSATDPQYASLAQEVERAERMNATVDRVMDRGNFDSIQQRYRYQGIRRRHLIGVS